MKFFKLFILIFFIPIFLSPIDAQANPYTVVNKLPGLNILSRNDWGCPDFDPDSRFYCYGPEWTTFRNPISHIVIHHTATTNNATDWAAQMRSIWDLHAHQNDWTDVGYNYLIDPNGVVYEGKYGGEGTTGGHLYLNNIGTVGIALIGNYDTRNLTPQTYESLKNLLTTLFTRYKIDPEELAINFDGNLNPRLSAHKDWFTTECPGDNVYPYVAQLRKDISYELKKYNAKLNFGYCPNGYISKDNVCTSYSTQQVTSYLGTIHKMFIANDIIYTSSPESNSVGRVNTLDENDANLISQYIPSTTALVKHPNGKIYATQAIENRMIEISETTGSFQTLAGVGDYPRDIAIDSTGTMYVVNANSDDIYTVNPNGESSRLIEAGNYPLAIAIDSKDNVYVANYMSDSVTKITPSGIKTEYASTGMLPRDIAIDSNDNVYVLNEGNGEITQIDPSGNISRYVELDDQALSMAIDQQGNLYVTNYLTDTLSVVSTERKITKINNIGTELTDVKANSEGDIFVSTKEGNIFKINYNNEFLASTTPVFRFWSTTYGSHFFTASASETQEVMNKFNRATWEYENAAFKVYSTNDQEGLMPVYRFWSGKYQTHFYTINEGEKNEIISKFDEATWKYEGISYYTFTNPIENTKPVYRFWSARLASHFYTINEAEKNDIIARLSGTWSYEGVAWYAYE
jgi:streptogramin lyase